MSIRTIGLIAVLLAAAAGAGYCQETLPETDRRMILKEYPQTNAEKLQVRTRDTVIRTNKETISCSMIGFRDKKVTFRYEGFKISLPLEEVKKVLLAQDLFAVFQNRLESIHIEKFKERYDLVNDSVSAIFPAT